MSNFNNQNDGNRTLDEAMYLAKLKASYSSYNNMCDLFQILSAISILAMIFGGIVTLMIDTKLIYKFELYCIGIGLISYFLATFMESKMIYAKTIFEETTGEEIR